MSFRTGFLRAGLSSRRTTLHLFAKSNSTTAKSRIREYVDKLKSVNVQEVDVIGRYYPALAWEVSQLDGPSTSSPAQSASVSLDNLESMLETLAESGRPTDLRQIEGILADMTDLFDTPPNENTQAAIVRGLLRNGNTKTITRWLETMSEKPGGVRPTREHFHLLLEAYPTFTSFKNMRHLITMMVSAGCFPTNETYKFLLKGLWDGSESTSTPPHPSRIAHVLKEMKEHGLEHDPSISAFLSAQYHKRGLTRWADEIIALYDQALQSHLSPVQVLENNWAPLFTQTATRNGLEEALKLYPQYLEAGGKPTYRIFNALLRPSCSEKDVRRISAVLQTKPTNVQWSMAIAELCKRGDVDQALEIYRKIKEEGIIPHAPITAPIIRALFRNAPFPVEEEVVDKALELYHDLNKAVPVDSPVLLEPEHHNDGPDFDIYSEILHGIALSRNAARYVPDVKGLIDDMKARGIEVYNTSASIAVMRIRMATTEEDAYKEYLRRRSTLNQTGFERVLDAYCWRSHHNRAEVPSISRYFNIVKDMKKAGYEVNAKIYTIVLRHLGKLGSRAKRYIEYQGLMPRLISSTRRIHDLITLDASFTPDTYLWNQLMDTYQRLSHLGDAYRVWTHLHTSKTYDHVSVSILFDTCGFGNMSHHLDETMSRLKREGFQLSLHNWNTYIESLCRLGRMNHAVKTCCLEMKGSTAPTLETVEIIRSFISKPALEAEVLSRIKRYQPELYKQIHPPSPTSS